MSSFFYTLPPGGAPPSSPGTGASPSSTGVSDITDGRRTDYEASGLANLIWQFRCSTDLRKLLSIYLRQLQLVENAFFNMKEGMDKDSATGDRLDIIGSIVGEPRAGQTDAQYLNAINARIEINSSQATIEDVISVAIATSGGTVTFQISESYPAGFVMEINEDIDPSLVDVDRLASFISQARGGGILGILVYHVAGSFQYDGPVGTGFDLGKYGGASYA